MDSKMARRGTGPYRTLDSDRLKERVGPWLEEVFGASVSIDRFERMPGGASKEQFIFDTRDAGGEARRHVLRVDPLESIIETCRLREGEMLRAIANVVPVARVEAIDGDGSSLGQPALVTSFVQGATKPPTEGRTVVSGVGTAFPRAWRERLLPHFLKHLAAIHAFDWREADLPHFSAPTDHPQEAALWQVNWWSRAWHEDATSPVPFLAFVEQWMRRNLPSCEEPVVVHGDYRTGNFMFDLETAEITAILDWELVHLGDFHEDLGWIVQRLFSAASEDGESLACSLVTREALIEAYHEATGRSVNLRTLAFYEVLAAYKCAVMNLGTGTGVAGRGNNHQDIVLSWLASCGHIFCTDMARIIEAEAL